MTLRVQDRSPEVAAMEVDWAVCEALMGGTRAMREAGGTYLPRWPAEDPAAYADRLAVATLMPAYRRTVSVMAGKPFAKALTYGDDVPPRIRDMCQDIDLQGRDLHAFAADAFSRTIAFGLAGILVDHPKVEGVRTLADEKRIGARPYFALVRHSQILGWKSSLINGAMMIAQLRLAEVHEAPDGEFGVRAVKRVRVLEPGRFEVWQEPEKGDDYTLVEGGVTTLRAIPFVPMYGFREAFMIGRPPLLDLAHLNVKHWQSQSDQDNICHVARVPILVTTGVEDDGWSLKIGAGVSTRLPAAADMKYVEHTGQAIAAGRDSLQDLEQQMIQTGAEMLVKKPGDRSATEAANDADGNKSDLQRIAESFEDCLDAALQLLADWIGEPTGGHVSLFKDYGAMSLGQASGQLVITMQQGGLISKPTAIREMQRRGELDAGLDPDAELSDVGAEGPPLGAMVDGEAVPPAVPPADTTATPDAGGAPAQTVVQSAAPAPPAAASAQALPDFAAMFADLGRTLAAAFAQMPAAVVNVPQQAMPAINVEGPTITVNTPEQPASVVNVAPAAVTVEGAQIVVNTPDVTVAPAAITVEGAKPAQVTVNATIEKGGKVTFTEDAAGQITGAELD